MKLATALFHPEAELEVKDGIHVQEGDEKSLPHFTLGYPDGIGPFSKVVVDPDLFELVPRRLVECPLNGQMPQTMVDGELVCSECGVTAGELNTRRHPTGQEVMGVQLVEPEVMHDTIDVPNRLMEGNPVMIHRDPRIVEDTQEDSRHLGVLFVAEADTAMTCWIEPVQENRRFHILHARMLGTRTDYDDGVPRHSQERFLVLWSGDRVRICRKQYDEHRQEVIKEESFVIECDRDLRLRIVSHTTQGARKESNVKGAETQ